MTIKMMGLMTIAALGAGLSAMALPQQMNAPQIKAVAPHHAGYVKPGAAIELMHDYDGQTTLGEFETVTLTLNHMYTNGFLTVQLMPAEGLHINADIDSAPISLKQATPLHFPLQFSAVNSGAYYIALNVIYESDDGEQSRRVLSLPVIIGGAKPAKFQAAASQNLGQSRNGIIPLPAQEVIR